MSSLSSINWNFQFTSLQLDSCDILTVILWFSFTSLIAIVHFAFLKNQFTKFQKFLKNYNFLFFWRALEKYGVEFSVRELHFNMKRFIKIYIWIIIKTKAKSDSKIAQSDSNETIYLKISPNIRSTVIVEQWLFLGYTRIFHAYLT